MPALELIQILTLTLFEITGENWHLARVKIEGHQQLMTVIFGQTRLDSVDSGQWHLIAP